MKNTFFLLLAAFLALHSCKKNETTDKTGISEKTQAFTADSVVVNDSLKVVDSLTLKYTGKMLVFPTLKEKPLLDSIYFFAPKLKDYSKAGIQSYLDSEKSAFFGSVKKENNDWISDVRYAQQWYTSSDMKIVSHENGFMHIRYSGSSYMGGAHDNYFFNDRVFDLQNHRRVVLSDITSMDHESLSKLLMQNLDRKPGSATANGETVANKDMLLVDKIPVTENFYFDSQNLYFHYSPYEITAFAAGDVTIPIAWKDLGNTLNPEFKKRMKL